MSLLRQIIILLVLGGVGYGGWHLYKTGALPWLGQSAATQQGGTPGPMRSGIAVLMDEVRQETVENRVEAVGTTLAIRSVNVAAGASGTVRDINFEAGQSVAVGDVLVRLDEEVARADLAEARADLAEVRSRLERARTLRRNNTVAEATLEQLQAEEAAAIAEVDRANKRLADRVIRAPFSGVVGFRRVEIGARVQETTVLTGLDDLSAVEIEFSVSETLFGQVEPGQPVIAQAAAFPDRSFKGTVSTIDSRVDTTSRSFSVRALLDNSDRALPAGMFMHLTLLLDTIQALTVPEEAIIPQGGKTYLFVVKDGRAERRDVTLGGRMPGRVAVSAGVEAGEKIVIQGQQRLQNGSPVRDAATPPAGAGGQGNTRPAGAQS